MDLSEIEIIPVAFLNTAYDFCKNIVILTSKTSTEELRVNKSPCSLLTWKNRS